MRLLAMLLTACLVFGCSSTKKKAEEPDPDFDMGTEPMPEPKGDDDDDDDDDDDTAAKPKPKPKPTGDDYEINEMDCNALAGAYSRAWKNDELRKLNKKKLSKKQFEAAEAELENNKQAMYDNWQSQCYGTVGTAYQRSRLKCALKAKSMKRFNDCMDGLADAE